jgi:coenzyme PQQ precursor peptide PqqA
MSRRERGQPAFDGSVAKAVLPAVSTEQMSALGAGGRGCWLTALRRDPTLQRARIRPREMAMKWKTPVIIEIAVGLEINAYACAEVK